MVSYNGHLYATICTGTPENAPDDNSMQSFAMVRGDKNADGSYSWTPIVGDQKTDGAKYCFGIDPARTRSGAANLIAYNDYLYIGEYNDEEIALERILFNKSNTEEGGKSSMGGVDCSFVNANLEQSVNIYRMDKDENMELVVGDRTDMFPEGGISGLTSGFGRNENQYIWRMQKFDGKLYIGTFDTASLLEPIGQFSNGDIIDMTPEEWDSQVQRLRDLLNHLLDKKSPDDPIVPVNTLADDDSNEAVEVDDSNEAAEVDDSNKAVDVDDEKTEVAKGFGDLSDALEDAAGGLCDQAATMSQDFEDDAAYVQKIDGEIAYFKSFADQYQDMLDSYESLKQQYEDAYGTELPSDIQDALDKLLSEENLKKLQSVLTCMCYLRDAERGFDMYVTEDGVNFTTLTTNGFNDPYNHGLRTFAVTNQGLCLGTATRSMVARSGSSARRIRRIRLIPVLRIRRNPPILRSRVAAISLAAARRVATTSRAAPRPPSRRPLRRLRRTARCLALATRPSRWSWDCWLQLPQCLALLSSCASVLVARLVRVAQCPGYRRS